MPILAALLLSALPLPQQAAPALEVRVDLRVELLTLLARLCEFREFRMPVAESPYARRVEEWFGPLDDHVVFDHLKELRATRGVSYDAIASLAMHLGPLPGLTELAPFDAAPERLDVRWGGVQARPFLAALRDFVQESSAEEFFASEREFYAEVERRLAARLSASKALPWFDAVFGARTAHYVAAPGLLCGGGNYGVGIRYPDGRVEEIRPVFGCWVWDDDGLPVFDEGYLSLFIHELCHSYTNPLVDRFAEAIEGPGTRLHALAADEMARQAYGTWQTTMYETFVRASVVRCRAAIEGAAAGEEQARQEVESGFRWVPALARRLGEFEGARERHPTFADFVPELVKTLIAEAERLEREVVSAPKLVSIVPANGARDVDPALTTMTLTFDREMKDKSWSIAGNPADQPKVTGTLAYDAARKVLNVPIQLEAAKSYHFWLNTAQFQGFKAADGTPLAPVEVRFSTRAP